jgi:hypothetical protein
MLYGRARKGPAGGSCTVRFHIDGVVCDTHGFGGSQTKTWPIIDRFLYK